MSSDEEELVSSNAKTTLGHFDRDTLTTLAIHHRLHLPSIYRKAKRSGRMITSKSIRGSYFQRSDLPSPAVLRKYSRRSLVVSKIQSFSQHRFLYLWPNGHCTRATGGKGRAGSGECLCVTCLCDPRMTISSPLNWSTEFVDRYERTHDLELVTMISLLGSGLWILQSLVI
ncbi:hypothetical protein K469DRAFT_260272 [Zopfia rhizophila CBS 207.26]|uniref:Uncharacterized protein n=1 Tax=Zopfia rhizophila CBS 207.26 TaxID=1314779 RepID=A0A6A6DRM7_9PEZI|nr:hypothetical protein K469DRAFT_260272 [Zopfia rhizophila CBS 207.26]